MEKKFVIATGNKGKLKEFKALLKGYEVISSKEAGFNLDIEENGKTFRENALIKAKTTAIALNMPAIADDSGICVDALNGEPGIYSARYAGTGVDEDNNNLLLKNLRGKSNRNARFVCALACYFPNGKVIYADGKTEGVILESPCGENGFGYDPIFYSKDLRKSLGVASEEEKNSISHRARAINALIEKLKKEKL